MILSDGLIDHVKRTFSDHYRDMPKQRLLRLQEMFDRFVVNCRNDVHVAFNPFFSLASPALFERENGIIIRNRYYLQVNRRILLQAIVWFSKNVYSMMRATTLRCMGFLKGLSAKPVFEGRIERESEVLFVTWMNEGDLREYFSNKYDRFWGDLYRSCDLKGKKWQVLVIPLFKPGESEIKQCVKDTKVVLYANDSPSLMLYLKIICHGLLLIPMVLRNNHSKMWVLLYISSLFNMRACQAMALYSKMKTSVDISSALKVMMPWESQPEQKAICKCFRENGNNVYGYIHSSFGDAPFQYVKTIFDDTFYPNKYFTHSRDTASVLADLGYEGNSMEIVKPVRFKEQESRNFKGKCYLPYNHDDAEKYFPVVTQLVSEGVFHVKKICLHPSARVSNKLRWFIHQFPYTETAEDVVVVGFSAVIFEALEAGCVVYQIVDNGPGEIIEEFYPSIRRERVQDRCFKIALRNSHDYNLLAFDMTKTIADHLQ